MKKYIKNIVKSITFFGVLVVLLLVLSYVFMPKNNDDAYGGHHQLNANGIFGEADNSIDVLVIGDSESYTSIVPLELWHNYGYTTYICGTSGQLLYDTYDYLIKALKNQKPKVVIMETNAIYRKVRADKALNSWAKKTFSVFKYHNRFKKLTKDDFLSRRKNTWVDDYKGFELNDKVDSLDKVHDYMKYTDEHEEINSLNMRYLNKIVEKCQENNIKLVFVSAPSVKNWSYKRHNSVSDYAKKNNIDFIDLNLKQEEINIDWHTDTRDKGDHLNYWGALKATEYMGNYLSDLDILKDRRNDKIAEKWNQSYNRYQKRVSKFNRNV